MMALVSDPNDICLAMLGMVEGNGHPFSWSAIINGDYDADEMARCGYWALVESVRTERGPRQRVVAHLANCGRPSRAAGRGWHGVWTARTGRPLPCSIPLRMLSRRKTRTFRSA